MPEHLTSEALNLFKSAILPLLEFSRFFSRLSERKNPLRTKDFSDQMKTTRIANGDESVLFNREILFVIAIQLEANYQKKRINSSIRNRFKVKVINCRVISSKLSAAQRSSATKCVKWCVPNDNETRSPWCGFWWWRPFWFQMPNQHATKIRDTSRLCSFFARSPRPPKGRSSALKTPLQRNEKG